MNGDRGWPAGSAAAPPRSGARRRRAPRPVSRGRESLASQDPQSHAPARAPRRGLPRMAARAVLAAPPLPASRQNGIASCQFAQEVLESRYFAARSFGASAAAGSGSGGRAAAPPENRAMSQERNNATASLLRSSGWVVR